MKSGEPHTQATFLLYKHRTTNPKWALYTYIRSGNPKSSSEQTGFPALPYITSPLQLFNSPSDSPHALLLFC